VCLAIALILPAVQTVRGHTRRTQCKENLHQLGLALHNYLFQQNEFPPGIAVQDWGPNFAQTCQFVSMSPTCDNPAFWRVSGLTLLLPFLEERGTYDAYNVRFACCARENATATSHTIQTFACPSNPRQRNPMRLKYYAGLGEAGTTDYVFSMGGVGILTCENPFAVNTGSIPPGLRPPGAMTRAIGAFGLNRTVNLDGLKDGPSTTFLMGESAGGAKLAAGLAGSTIVGGAQHMDGASSSAFCDNPWSMGYIASRDGDAGFGSVFGATAWNAWYDTYGNLTDPANGANWFPYPINEGALRLNRPTWVQSARPASDLTGHNGAALPSSTGSTQGFRSYHVGMANFLLGDGSVRSFTESTDARVLVGYSSIRGREQLEKDE